MRWDNGLQGSERAIAATDDTPLRVIAGPGTGKTFSLMRRVMRLLQGGVSPHRLLVCTFTRTAARDLQHELGKLSIKGIKDVWAGTIHSYCFGLLSKADVLSLTGRYPRPLLKFEERFLIEDLSGTNDEGIRELKIRLAAFSAAWARLQSDSPGWPTSAEDRQLLAVLKPWLLYHKCMLIGELVVETLAFLRNNPASTLRPRFEHVLIDEYQDLNKAEQVLIDKISETASMTVIGDEDQSVYSFKYAHPEGIAHFASDHPGTHDESLVECRRCPQRIVRMANELISNNRTRADRTLSIRTSNPEGNVLVVQWPDLQQEAAGIASFIRNRVNSMAANAGEVLVLSPRRQFGYAIRDALNSAGVPAHSFFHEEVLDGNPKSDGEYGAQEAFSLLTLLARPSDRVALRCWVGFGGSSLRSNPWNLLRDHCETTGDDPQKTLAEMLNGHLRIPHTAPLVERYDALLSRRAELERLQGLDLVNALFPATETWAEPIRQFASAVSSADGPRELLESLQTFITQPELPTDVDYVRVMSLHKSKGLTAKIVVVSGIVDGIIPTLDLSEPPKETQRMLEEQRRLFYVAITRSTDTLVLSSMSNLDGAMAHRIGARVMAPGTTIQTVASPFILELGPDCPDAADGRTTIV